MNRWTASVVVAAVALTVASMTASQQAPASFAGTWALAGPDPSHFAMTMRHGEDGAVLGRIDSEMGPATFTGTRAKGGVHGIEF